MHPYVKLSCLAPKTNTTLLIKYIPINKKTRWKYKPEGCLLYSPHAWVTWAGGTSKEPELVSILRPDCLKVEGTGTTCQERNTLGPTVSGPSAWDHGLKIQVGYLTTKPDYCTQRMMEPLVLRLRSDLISMSPGAGVPAPSFFDSTPITGFL